MHAQRALLAALLLLAGALADCPGAAAPGRYCAPGGAEAQCPAGASCAGGSAGPVPCMVRASCAAAGLAAEISCAVWRVDTPAGNYPGYSDGIGTAASFSTPRGIAGDATGAAYVADSGNNRIRKVTPMGSVSTLAGGFQAAFANGTGALARFSAPGGVTVHPLSGDIYCADTGNNRIRRITIAGVVTTFAGGAAAAWADGNATSARFSGPAALAIDNKGIMFVADRQNHRVRTISPFGVVTTLAGNGSSAPFTDGVSASMVTFSAPGGVAVDGAGRVYVADTSNGRIKVITPIAGSALANVTTLAGGGGADTLLDGTGTAAAFRHPQHISVAANGNLLVADFSSLRMVTPLGAVTTLAGSISHGFVDGLGQFASFFVPAGVFVDANGTIFIADTGNHRIRRAACNLTTCPVTFYCSSGAPLLCPPGAFCPPNTPFSLPTPCPGGTFSAAEGATTIDTCMSCPVGSFCPPGTSTPYRCRAGFFGATPGLSVPTCSGACAASPGFGCPAGSTFNASEVQCSVGHFCPGGSPAPAVPCGTPGNCGVAGLPFEPACLWVVTTLTGSAAAGSQDGARDSASFSNPKGVAVDKTGALYVADAISHKIRKIDTLGAVATLAGSGLAWFADGIGARASFNSPSAVALDPLTGRIFCTDSMNHRVRSVTTTGVTTTFAGSSANGWVDGSGTSAAFSSPTALSVDRSGVVYVADTLNRRVRKITPLGWVTTLAGNGIASSANGIGSSASFFYPTGVTVDDDGNVYIADLGGNPEGASEFDTPLPPRIKFITPFASVSTFAGGVAPWQEWVDGVSTAAGFPFPQSLAIAANGNLIVLDENRIRMITPLGFVTTVSGSAAPSFADGLGTAAMFKSPAGIAVNTNGTIFIADSGNNRIRSLTCSTCPPGYSCNIGGSGGPVLCPRGQYCPPGALSPIPCPSGTFSASVGAPACSKCPRGTFQAESGASACLGECPPGTYGNASGGTSASQSCKSCPRGSFNADPAAPSSLGCAPCAPGSASYALGAADPSTCQACAPGTLAAAAGASNCTPAPPGTFSNPDGTTFSDCALGTYRSAPGGTSQADCSACPTGKSTVASGATALTQCLALPYACDLGAQPTVPQPASSRDCAPLACAPPLRYAAYLSSPTDAAARAASSACVGCAPRSAGAFPACTPCASGTLCPGLTSRPLHNFSQPTGSGASADAALLAVTCPSLAQTPFTPPAGPAASLLSRALTGLFSGAAILSTLLAIALATVRTTPRTLAAAAPMLCAVDLFSMSHRVPLRSSPVNVATPLGGLFSLMALTTVTTFAAYIVLQYIDNNTLVQSSLGSMTSDVWGTASALPWASAGGAAGDNLVLRITASGEPGACAAPLSWTSSGLRSGAWALTALASDCSGGSSSSTAATASQLALSCPGCQLTSESTLVLTFHHSCQSLLLEAGGVPPYPSSPLTRSLLAAPPALTAASPSGALLSALTWTLAPVLCVLQDRISGGGALGWLLTDSKVSAAPALVPAAAGGGGVLLQPAAAAVTLTIHLPLGATYASTVLTPQVQLISVLANLVGLSGIVAVFGVLFGHFERGSRHLLGEEAEGGGKAGVAAAGAAAVGAAAGGGGGGGGGRAVLSAAVPVEEAAGGGGEAGAGDGDYGSALVVGSNPLREQGAGAAAAPPAAPAVSRWQRHRDGKDVWYTNEAGEPSWELPEGAVLVEK